MRHIYNEGDLPKKKHTHADTNVTGTWETSANISTRQGYPHGDTRALITKHTRRHFKHKNLPP